MANFSNHLEPMTLIDLDSENPTGTQTGTRNVTRFSTFKTNKKMFAFYGFLVMIPLLVFIIATVCTNQEMKQMKIEFAAEMKITSNTL